MTWYRVHFRKKQIIVDGDEALAAHKRRTVPKVLFVEELASFTCSVCGHVGPWAEEKRHWCWVGRSDQFDSKNAKVRRVFCSKKCRSTAAPDRGEGRRTWWWEPGGFRSGVWQAIHAARRAANPRHFPWPEFDKIPDLNRKTEGQCRWCGERITSKWARQRSYHDSKWGDPRDCKREALLHTDLDTQIWFLIARDGPGCRLCKPRPGRWVSAGAMYPADRGNWIRWSERLEVDHIIELWAVLYLPPDERRPYFGPDNQWLLCDTHHKWKSKNSAAERAAARR